MRSSARVSLALSIAAACLALFACPPDQTPPPGEDEVTLCTGPGESYGIQDFPCDATTVEGWVGERDGHRERQHAWYLFAGLNQPAGDSFLWHIWPTSTQTFPAQYDTTSTESLALGPLPGSKLERPTPATPRFAGSDVSVDPGVDAENLALPGGPKYYVPDAVRTNPAYAGCVQDPDDPQKADLIDGPRFQSNGDIMVAGVVYSPDASQWILDQELWNGFVLDAKVPPGTGTTTRATQMPHGSVVLKPMLWPVPGDGYVPLPLWDFADPDADQIVVDGTTCEIYSGFERTELWQRAVALTAQAGTPPATATATYLDSDFVELAMGYSSTCEPDYVISAGITYENVPVAGLDRFYTLRFTGEELDAMHPCDRALLDQSAYWSYGRAFAETDALALVAMHMMTKEQPGWTFQSAWWFDEAATCDSGQCSRYASQRPDDVEGVDTWKNYLITTTYGQNQKPDAPGGNQWPKDLTTDTTWPVAFNPYIELAATHPIETNCINCHRRAAWPSRLRKSLAYPDRNSAYLVTGDGVPGLLDMFEIDNPVFDGLTTLDSMWAMSDRANYPPVSEGEEGTGER